MCRLFAAISLQSIAISLFAVDVISGTVVLETASEVPNPVPSVIPSKAAIWMDMGETSVVSEDGGQTLSMWRDCRETAAKGSAPTLYYATPAWTNGGESATVSYDYRGVNPAIETMGAAQRKTLNFHGRSGIYLRLKKNGSNVRLFENVRHVFAVHNPTNWFGAVVGGATENRLGAFLLKTYDNSYMYKMSARGTDPLFWNRVDLGNLGYLSTSIRFSVDGEVVDPFSYLPHYGWQLLDAAFTDSIKGGTIESIFYQRYENFPASQPENYLKYSRAGGDYISELMVFTNQLSETEIKDIRSYLNAKWGLPTWRDPEVGNIARNPNNYLVPPKPVHEVAIAADAIAEASVADGAVSRPFCMTGDGKLVKKGAGALVVGTSQSLVPFSGEVELQAGSIYLRGGMAPAFKAVPGRTVASTDYVPGDDNTTANQADGAVRLTVNDNSGSTEFVKAGACQAKVSDVDPAVTKVVVENGELTLGSARNGGYRGEILIENGDFEQEFFCEPGDGNYSKWAYNLCLVANTGMNGWYRLSGSSYFQRVGRGCKFTDGSLVEDAVTADGKRWLGTSAWNLKTTVGNGNQVVNLQGGNVYTYVTLPDDGCYEVTFEMSERYSSRMDIRNAKPIVVKIGTSTSNWQDIGHAQSTARFWTTVKMRTPKLTAGRYVLGFMTEQMPVSVDCSVYLDNVKMRFASRESRDTYAIPNGDFEKMDVTVKTGILASKEVNYWSVNHLSMDNVSEGWTFAPSTWGDGSFTPLNAIIGIVNPNIHPKADNGYEEDGVTPHYCTRQGTDMQGADTHGTTALLMIGDVGTATTTFTPPAGKWKLRHRLNRTLAYGDNAKLRAFDDVAPVISAKVMIGGATTELGTITKGIRDSIPMERFDYPVQFETDGVTPVTLTLANTKAGVGALVDDVELVGENSVADMDGELIKNGGFEPNSLGWEQYIPPLPTNQIARINNGPGLHAYLHNDAWAYGAIQYEGRFGYMFKNLSGIRQNFRIPAPGLYRLRFGMRSRADLDIYADGDMVILLSKGNVTNQIAFINYQYQRNYAEREYLVKIDEAGAYTLHFENQGPHAGRGTASNESTCFIDGVSFCQVDWDVPETLSISADTKIAIGPNATLNLAFTGTNVVRSVRHAGSVVGCMENGCRVINSKTCPNLVSGVGTLMVRPSGLVILVR